MVVVTSWARRGEEGEAVSFASSSCSGEDGAWVGPFEEEEESSSTWGSDMIQFVTRSQFELEEARRAVLFYVL